MPLPEDFTVISVAGNLTPSPAHIWCCKLSCSLPGKSCYTEVCEESLVVFGKYLDLEARQRAEDSVPEQNLIVIKLPRQDFQLSTLNVLQLYLGKQNIMRIAVAGGGGLGYMIATQLFQAEAAYNVIVLSRAVSRASLLSMNLYVDPSDSTAPSMILWEFRSWPWTITDMTV